MNADDPRLLDVVAAISDGDPIDWDPEVSDDTEDRRTLLRSLRFLAIVADVYRGLQAAPDPPADGAGREAPPEVGRYRISRLIAEGGMGAVHEAEQDRPRRTVALKVIRPGHVSSAMLKRFERELQVLARLQHPGIAQIYDAGAADFGHGSQPYFAMELIRGAPLIRHAEERRLSTAARIGLIASVADAVEHAHQKGVIHRDLKPANIMVDESGQPKILDFGVARATDSDIQATLGTNIDQLVGTIPYMSPEQVGGDPNDLDTRSDVYSLGVVLYELLTGRLPYNLTGKPIPEMLAIIREQEPLRLGSIDKSLRGDVETIVAKALEKDRERRYQSGAELALDLRRYLRSEPIAARPPTALYRVRRFARRRPELLGGLVVASLALGAGIVGTSLGLINATRQRDLANAATALAETRRLAAEREAQRAIRVMTFMQDLLASARPGATGTGRDVKVAEVLDRAAANLPSRFKDEPELEMEARSTIGQSYLSLGSYDEAEINLKRALELADSCRPEGAEDRLVIADRFAWALSASGHDREKGEELARSNLELARRALGPAHPVTLDLLNTLSFNLLLQWKIAEARPVLEDLLPALRALPPEHRKIPIAAVMLRLAMVREYSGDIPGARELAHSVIAEAPQDGSVTTDDIAQRGASIAADVLINEGNLVGGEQQLRSALAAARRTLGRSHGEALRIGAHFADLLSRLNRPKEAYGLYKEWLAYAREHLPWEGDNTTGPWTLQYMANLAARAGRRDEAAGLWREHIAVCRRQHGDNDSLAQESWRRWTMRLGLGIQDRWESEAIRTQVRRIVVDSLMIHPTKSFLEDEMAWDRLRFRLVRWSPDVAARSDVGVRPNTIEGSLARLKTLAEPDPGLYLLSLEVPRKGGAPLREAAWMLVSPWSLELYSAVFPRGGEEEAWRQRSHEPVERRTEPALSLEGWWDTGFGPSNQDYSFGIIATTTIDVPTGAYRFLVTSSDGARLWIDDRLAIDAWTTRRATTDEARIQLSAGPHKVRLEYFQAGDTSLLWVRAEPLDYRAAGMRGVPAPSSPGL